MTKLIGIILGIATAIVVSRLVERPRAIAPPPPMMISECDGALAEIAIQYVSGSDAVLPVYRAFLPQLPRDVIVDVMCPDEHAFEELRAFVGKTSCTLRPIITKHPMTAWSRDRWVAMQSKEGVTLLAPREEDGASAWPERLGDQQVAFDLADAFPATIVAHRSHLAFDGGDLLANRDHIFVTPAVVRRNVQHTVSDASELRTVLQREMGRELTMLDEAPPHHAGMFMMSVGNKTMLVGDPSLARQIPIAIDLPGGADFSDATQRQFDAVAEHVARLGYRIVRIPTIVAPDGKTYLTYVNVITDHRDGKHIVYLPQYRGADALNAAAATIWRDLGYEIRTVDCTSTFRFFGNLHCLVNVVRRT